MMAFSRAPKSWSKQARSDVVFSQMSTRITLWLIWLLMWHASGSHAQQCSQVAGQQAVPSPNGLDCQATQAATGSCQQPQSAQSQGACGGQTTTRAVVNQPGLATVSLHEYVYKSDFAGFRERMKFLDQQGNQPALISSLQSVDDKGMTIAHLLACAGRADELFLVTQAVHKLQEGLVPLQAKVLKRAALENLSHNASCSSCRPDRTEHELIPHVRLELVNPRQTIFLYGNVTPLECAAAHGHMEAMKLLMQRGVSGGRVLIVAQHFGLENTLFEATAQARAEGGYGVDIAPDLPDRADTPMRMPRQRRTDRKAKGKSKSSSSNNSSSGSRKKGAAAAAASPNSMQQQQGACGTQSSPPALKVTPVQAVVGPGGAAASIGSVASSLLAVRNGKEKQDPAKPVSTPTQLSEFMDITALWLLSIMLSFPAWSTFCLLWRKMFQRRWALQESIARVRRAVTAMTKPFKRDASTTAALAAGASAAAAAATPSAAMPHRSGGSGSEGKGSKAAAAGAPQTPRQQRKAGASMVLPSAAQDARLAAVKGTPSPGGALFRAISAPETSFRAHLSSLAKKTPEAEGRPSGAAARRQSYSIAAAAEPSTGGATGAAVAACRLSRVSATAVEAGCPPVQRSGISSTGAAPKAAAGGATAAAAAAAVAASSSGTQPVVAGKLKRGKSTAAGASAAVMKETAGTKMSSAPQSNQPAPGHSKPHSTKQPLAEGKTSDGSGGSSSSSTVALGTSEKGLPGSKGVKLLQAAEQQAITRSASGKDSPRRSTTSKSTSDVADLVGTNQTCTGATTAAAAAPGSGVASETASKPKAVSALSAALKPAATASRGAAAAAAAAAAAGAANLEVTSPTGRSSRSPRSFHINSGHRLAGGGTQFPVSPSAVSSTSSVGSARHTLSAAAAVAAAARDAAAASAAATAALRRTGSGSVALTSSPNKDMDDVLPHCRDQDRRHHGMGSGAADASSRDMACSAPTGNAWTPAAAAARAARAAGGPKPHEMESDRHILCTPRAAGCERDASSTGEAGAPTQGSPAAAATADSSSSCGHIPTAAREGAPPGSQTAAAIAAGTLPTSASGSAAAAGGSATAADADMQPMHVPHGSSDSIPSGVVAAPINCTAEAPSNGLHTPVLDPPVALLPRSVLAQLDAAPGGAAAGSSTTRTVSALEPGVLHDLADLVAASIAQEVQARKPHLSGVPADRSVAAAGSSGGSPDKVVLPEARRSDPGAPLTDVVGPQLVHQTLQEVFTQLSAGKSGASSAAADSPPAAAPGEASRSNQGALLGPSLDVSSGTAKACSPKREADCFNCSSATRFADLAAKLQLPSHQQDVGPQQQDVVVSAPHLTQLEQQQRGWFGTPPASVPVLGGLCDPLGAGRPAGPGLVGSMDLPASTGLSGAMGLQLPPAVPMPDRIPAGAMMLPHQGLPAMAPNLQQQQQQLVVQQMVPQQGALLAVHPSGGQQVMQLVAMQAIPVASAQGQIIRLANGQLVKGQLVAVQGQHLTEVPVVRGPSVPGNTAQVLLAPGAVLNVQQHVGHAPVQQQQQVLSAHRVFYPQSLMQDGGMPQSQGIITAGQQQQQLLPGVYVNKVAPQPGSLLHASGLQQRGASPAGSGGLQQQQPKQQSSLTGSTTSSFSRSPTGTMASSSSAGGNQSSTSPIPARVVVLEAPAGPNTPTVSGTAAVANPEELQKLLHDPQRHNETGVYVAWPAGGDPAAVTVPKASGAMASGPLLEPTESAQMAAELDELLHQANQLVGWSSLPKDTQQQKVADDSEARASGKIEPGTNALHGLEGLQLPDGFTSSE